MNTMVSPRGSTRVYESVPIALSSLRARARRESLGINSLFEAFALRIHYRIVNLVANAKHSLHLSSEAEEQELTVLRAGMQTYATTLALTVIARTYFWDEWPAAYHPVSHQCNIPLPCLRKEEVERVVTAAFLKRARRQWRAHFGKRSSMEDRFIVRDELDRIVMIGQLQRFWHRGNRHRRRQHVTWMPAPDRSQIEELGRRAQQHSETADRERGWDNYSSAEHESQLARLLRQEADQARYADKLFP